jgi:hypothetical protein
MGKVTSSDERLFFVGSHETLFEDVASTDCDACGLPLARNEEDEEDAGYGMPGSGVYLWKRGDVIELENVPLCASCASAIGMAALARWEIEEEEG